MRNKNFYKAMACLTVAAFAAFLVCAAPAMASEEGHGLRWGDFGWRCLNLVIFAAILWHFAGKIIVGYFSGRKARIQDGLNDLTAKREAAEASLKEIERRIANLDSEREAIIAESKAQALALQKDIIEKAKAQADLIVANAKAAAESEAQNIVQQIRSAVADELIDATQERLLASLKKGTHEKLIENSLKKVVL